MIDAYYWPTPNGWKLSIALEEMGLAYNVIPINIGKGEQFGEDFLKVAPNNRIPAIVDHDPPGGGEPISVFETGAILLYLANKTGMFYPEDLRKRTQVHEWLMWQMGGLGPMIGQAGHFKLYHSEKIPYAIDRYHSEMLRLYGVLDKRLEGREYIVDEFSIADIACWPWVITYKRQEVDLQGQFPNVYRWYKLCQSRPALRRGYEVGKEHGKPGARWTDETRKNMMPQNQTPR